MSNLFEINAMIQKLISESVDEDGVIDEAVFEQLDRLQMDREEKIENLALFIKDLSVYAGNLKAEKLALAERQSRAEAQVERLKKYLMDSLNGEKRKTPKYEIRYTHTKALDIYDEAACKKWLSDNEHWSDCVKTEVSIRKDAVKALMREGTEIDGATLIENVSMSVK